MALIVPYLTSYVTTNILPGLLRRGVVGLYYILTTVGCFIGLAAISTYFKFNPMRALGFNPLTGNS